MDRQEDRTCIFIYLYKNIFGCNRTTTPRNTTTHHTTCRTLHRYKYSTTTHRPPHAFVSIHYQLHRSTIRKPVSGSFFMSPHFEKKSNTSFLVTSSGRFVTYTLFVFFFFCRQTSNWYWYLGVTTYLLFPFFFCLFCWSCFRFLLIAISRRLCRCIYFVIIGNIFSVYLLLLSN